MALSAEQLARIAKAKQVGPNMTEAQKGGGDFEIHAAGVVRLRFIEYIELGEHTEQSGQFVGKKNQKVLLRFELSGKNHPPIEADGKKIPRTMVYGFHTGMNMSLTDRSGFFKLFKVMNAAHGDTATTMVELLGKEFLGTIEHVKKGDKTHANLTNIRKAVRIDEDDNEVPITVDEPLSPIKMFVWDIADMSDWDSIFIDGTWPERKDDDGKVVTPAKSKNVYQEMIRASNKFDSLPIAGLLKSDKPVTAADEKAMDDELGAEDNAAPVDGAGEGADLSDMA